ncbi:hypothetical protein [Nocardia sp. NBC_01009]|nr:hypothetical protein OHA42_18025 [Nocardia sp. NBC_01009]
MRNGAHTGIELRRLIPELPHPSLRPRDVTTLFTVVGNADEPQRLRR